MARLGRTEVRFPEKLKCQTMNGKQNCADIMSTNHHHLCCKPFRSTIIVYYRFKISSDQALLDLLVAIKNLDTNGMTAGCVLLRFAFNAAL